MQGEGYVVRLEGCQGCGEVGGAVGVAVAVSRGVSIGIGSDEHLHPRGNVMAHRGLEGDGTHPNCKCTTRSTLFCGT